MILIRCLLCEVINCIIFSFWIIFRFIFHVASLSVTFQMFTHVRTKVTFNRQVQKIAKVDKLWRLVCFLTFPKYFENTIFRYLETMIFSIFSILPLLVQSRKYHEYHDYKLVLDTGNSTRVRFSEIFHLFHWTGSLCACVWICAEKNTVFRSAHNRPGLLSALMKIKHKRVQ